MKIIGLSVRVRLYQYITSLLNIYNIQILLHGPQDLLVSGIWGTYLSGFAVIRGEISIKGGMLSNPVHLLNVNMFSF